MSARPFSLVFTQSTRPAHLGLIVEETLNQTLASRLLIEDQTGRAAVIVQGEQKFSFQTTVEPREALDLAMKRIAELQKSPIHPRMVQVILNGYIALIWPASALPGRSHVPHESE